MVDETDLAFETGYPGPLQKVLGIRVEEIDALYPDQTNTIVMRDRSGAYPCRRLADLLHAETAEVIATYGSDFYAGMPVVTRNSFGAGAAYYIGTDADDVFLDRFYGEIAAAHGIAALLNAPRGVEVTTRTKDEQALIFVLNHNAQAVVVKLGEARYRDLLTVQTLAGELALGGYGVAILTRVAD